VVTSAWPELSGRRLHADVSRHAAAHTVMGPGFQLASPPVRTRTDNVLLCGDWVHPGWSCFYLERAAATGRLAAEGAARIAGGSLRPGDAARRPPPPARSFEVLRRVLRVARSLGLLVPPVSRARWREHRRRR